MPGLIKKQPDGRYRILCGTCLHLIASEVRSPENLAPLVIKHEKEECPATLTPGFWLFDNPITRKFTEARMEFVTPLLRQLRKSLGVDSALDVGCGLGDSSGFLSQFGIPKVVGIDGRAENIAEAQKRHVGPLFQVANAEELPELGCFDLVLCFGLLYHLENPFRAIRSLQALTGKLLLIESMCAPGQGAYMELLDEYEVDNQGLDYVAFYPTEACLVKMLYRSGFLRVYGFVSLPDHELYRATFSHVRRRTMLVAAMQELQVPQLKLLTEPRRPWDIWQTRLAKWRMRFRHGRGSFAAALRGQRGSTK